MLYLYRKEWQDFASAQVRGQTFIGREKEKEGAAARNFQPVQRVKAEATTIEVASFYQGYDHAGAAPVLRSNGQGGLEEKEMKNVILCIYLFT